MLNCRTVEQGSHFNAKYYITEIFALNVKKIHIPILCYIAGLLSKEAILIAKVICPTNVKDFNCKVLHIYSKWKVKTSSHW